MKRRDFISTASLFSGACLLSPHALARQEKADPMARIGMTTVVFRDRFSPDAPNALKLADVPAYYTERFGIHNIEFWTKHFESTTPGYLKELKKSLKKNKCELFNIQVDTLHDLSDPDPEKREKALAENREWVDIAQFLGASYVRASSMRQSYKYALESLKQLNKYCSDKGVILLVENHFDLFSTPSNHTKLVDGFGDHDLELLADFGNYPPNVDRYEAIKLIAPHTGLVSAKTVEFNEAYEHVSYDFGRCLRIMEDAGYTGIYSIEQWGPNVDYDYERIVDWMISQIKNVL